MSAYRLLISRFPKGRSPAMKGVWCDGTPGGVRHQKFDSTKSWSYAGFSGRRLHWRRRSKRRHLLVFLSAWTHQRGRFTTGAWLLGSSNSLVSVATGQHQQTKHAARRATPPRRMPLLHLPRTSKSYPPLSQFSSAVLSPKTKNRAIFLELCVFSIATRPSTLRLVFLRFPRRRRRQPHS